MRTRCRAVLDAEQDRQARPVDVGVEQADAQPARVRARARGSPRRCSCRRRPCPRRRRRRGARWRGAPARPWIRRCRRDAAARSTALGGTISHDDVGGAERAQRRRECAARASRASLRRACARASRTFTRSSRHVHVLDHPERHEVARETWVAHGTQGVGDGVGGQCDCFVSGLSGHARGSSSGMDA